MPKKTIAEALINRKTQDELDKNFSIYALKLMKNETTRTDKKKKIKKTKSNKPIK
jgi:hypothetical protein